jgi:hypothetical protein
VIVCELPVVLAAHEQFVRPGVLRAQRAVMHKKLVAVALPVADVDDQSPRQRDRGLRARRRALQPLAALLLLRGLAVARALGPRLELRRVARQHQRIDHAQRLPILAQQQRGVQQQADRLVGIVADGPQPARVPVRAEVQRRGVLHCEHDGLAARPLQGRIAMRCEHRSRLDHLIVEKPVGGLRPRPIPAGPRDGGARLRVQIGCDLFQAPHPARVSQIERSEFVFNPVTL